MLRLKSLRSPTVSAWEPRSQSDNLRRENTWDSFSKSHLRVSIVSFLSHPPWRTYETYGQSLGIVKHIFRFAFFFECSFWLCLFIFRSHKADWTSKTLLIKEKHVEQKAFDRFGNVCNVFCPISVTDGTALPWKLLECKPQSRICWSVM